MAQHAKQHYIPASYLKSWCDPDTPKTQEPYVWKFTKDGKSSKKKAPNNIFHENNMYTIQCPEIGRDLRLEKGLSQLENDFVKLRRQKLDKKEDLSDDDRYLLCVFAAASRSRTKAYMEFQQRQFGAILQKVDKMREAMRNASPEQQSAMASIPSVSNGPSFSYSEVKEIQKNPIQNLLPVHIENETPMLFRLDLAILYTDDDIGFITSDRPCVWFDPEGYKRPPIYSGPGLAYETTEITLPISPSLLACFNQKGVNGYLETNQPHVDNYNRRTRFLVHESFIVNKDYLNPSWF